MRDEPRLTAECVGVIVVMLLAIFFLLTGCARPEPTPASSIATTDATTAAAATTRAASLHEQADAAAIEAATAAAKAAAERSAGNLPSAQLADLMAAEARGRADGTRRAAIEADRRAELARQDAEQSATFAAESLRLDAEAARLAAVRSRCEWLAAGLAAAGILAGATLAYLGRPRMAVCAAAGGPIAAVLVLTFGAALPLIYEAVPWILLGSLILALSAAVWIARDLRAVAQAPTVSHLPPRLARAAARLGWTP
jgi:type IV secretory pathway VirB10-like protein